MSSTPPNPRTPDDSQDRLNIRTYFQTWSPREVILLAVACLGVIAAIGFGFAWGTNLVPFETVWGPVSSWVNVGVTALAFTVAGLTFYLRFREVAQNDDEKKGEKDKEDLQNTFELRQLTSGEEQRMVEEASRVNLELWPGLRTASDLPDWERKYRVQFIVRNQTGKQLTDVVLRLPSFTTHYGHYPESAIAVGDSAETSFATDFIEAWFAGNSQNDFQNRPDMTGPMGAFEALEGKAALSFRIASGPRWNLVFNPAGKQRPTLDLT